MIESELVSRAATILDARIGLKPDASFRPRLARALRDVADAKLIDVGELVAAVSTDAELFDALVNRVTIQESGFFRHPEQFATLATVLMPSFRKPISAWSAACANGQEAYSLAMTIKEVVGGGRVLASDVSLSALDRTAVGSYNEREMGGVSSERRRRHFAPSGRRWQVDQNLRSMITLRRHNLVDAIPPQVATCQVVMCRNVLIYFKRHHAEQFLGRLADVMDRSAVLFVGAAETVWQMTDRFEPELIGGAYAFRPLPRGSVRRITTEAKPSAVPAPDALAGVVPTASALPLRASSQQPAVTGRAMEPAQDEVEDYGRLGRRLVAAGSLPQAVVAFRRWAYMSPDDPAAHFQLGATLDAADQQPSARRAYRAALAALDRCTSDQLATFLDGHDRAGVRRLLVDRCLSASDHDVPAARS